MGKILEGPHIAHINVLHITPHLGGGVGRVLGKVAQRRKADRFICLEEPKSLAGFNGIDIKVSGDIDYILEEIDKCDILQLEWWHHPAMAKLFMGRSFTARTVIWCHTSGLHYPTIPSKLIKAPNAFLFTCTASTDDPAQVVNSSGGFNDIPVTVRESDGHNLRYGYIGSLNKSKIHPHIEQYLDAVDDPFFSVDFWGDHTVNPNFYLKSSKISMRRFSANPVGVLSCMDVFVYLLNPTHYGTTENALLEAMASSVVPVVLNNKVESNIVKDGETGIVISTPSEFAAAIKRLNTDHAYRTRLAHNARDYVRKHYSLDSTVEKLERVYANVMGQNRFSVCFDCIFGSTPEEIFYSCTGKYKDVMWGDSKERIKHRVLYEDSKSSPIQFNKYFPESKEIQCIVDMLNKDTKGTHE